MPHSDERLRPWIAEQLAGACDLESVKTVVDVGAGAGTWKDFLSEKILGAHWIGIEIWEPYLEMWSLRERYDEIIVDDARVAALPEADLYIFGDVLEHMPADDAIELWDRARKVAKILVINIPVRLYEQSALFGNPHEAHLHHWDTESVLESFQGIFAYHAGEPPSVVGAFIARGDGAESL